MEREGVIKYRLDFTPAEAVDENALTALQQWRLTLYQLGLIGQDPERYGGLGYGNISQAISSESYKHGAKEEHGAEEEHDAERKLGVEGYNQDGDKGTNDLPERSWSEVDSVAANAAHTARDFIISGTQTGELSELAPEHYALVNLCDPIENHIIAQGPIKPSSEALTHGAIYALSPEIQAVIHVHSPEIWSLREKLLMPSTPMDVPYGTPEMAQAVQQLWQSGQLKSAPVLAMGGHEDGIISFGRNMAEAGMAMLNAFQWARALQLADDAEAGKVELAHGF